jgi:formylglycine-generating enzyme required for sulfatase activity
MATGGGFHRVGVIAAAAWIAFIVPDVGSGLLQVNYVSVVAAQEIGGREMSAGERPANPKVVHHKAAASARGRGAFLAEQAVERGNSARDSGDYSRAETEYHKALKLNKKEERAYLGLGNIYFDQHQYPDAVGAYQDAIRLKPNYAEAYSNLSYAYYRQRRLNDAEKAANRALELNHSLETAVTRLGHVYSDRGKYSDAIVQYQRAIKINPNYAEAHNGLGSVYCDLKRYSEAIAEIEAAITFSHKKWPNPYVNLGLVYWDLKRYSQAVAEYQKAITLDPKWSIPHNNLGLVYRDLKQYGEAIAEYQRAITLDGNDPLPHNNLGDVYFLDHQGSNAAAIDQYREAIRLNPNRALPYFSLGSVYRQDGRQDEAQARFEKYIELVPKFRNQAGIDMIWIPPGSFIMGSTNGDAAEKPVHQVTINYSFYMGKYEVTQAQWRSVMGNNPSSFKADNLPVETVSWLDTQQFLQKLNQINDGYTYRLPTEAEWEYAARAGTTTAHFWGGDVNQACGYANVADHTAKAKYPNWTIVDCRDGYAETSPTGSFQSNSFGLFDTIGNVWEWCEDWYHPTYEGAPTDGSAWLNGSEQKYRVLRGGAWLNYADDLRSAFRGWSPDARNNHHGFRVIAVVRTN